jgi:hypothetical protein
MRSGVENEDEYKDEYKDEYEFPVGCELLVTGF